MSPEFEQICDRAASVTGAPCIWKVAGPSPGLDEQQIETQITRRQIVAIRDQPKSDILDSPALMLRYGICRRMQVARDFDLNRDDRAAPSRHNDIVADQCPKSPVADRISFKPQQTCRNALGPLS